MSDTESNPLDQVLAEPDNRLARWGSRMIKAVLLIALVMRSYAHGLANGNRPLNKFETVVIGLLMLVGALGVLFGFIGWMQNPYAHEKLPKEFGTNSIIARTIVATFGICLILLGSWIYVNFRAQLDWLMACIVCVLLTWGGLILFLSTIYKQAKHRAITTYFNILTPLIAFALFPVLWPMLAVFTVLEPKWDDPDAAAFVEGEASHGWAEERT